MTIVNDDKCATGNFFRKTCGSLTPFVPANSPVSGTCSLKVKNCCNYLVGQTCFAAFAMAYMEIYESKSNTMADVAEVVEEEKEEEDSQNSSVFFELNPYFIQLLGLIWNPKNDHSCISHILRLLQRLPRKSLESLLDYVLSPLLSLLDAAVKCRSPKKLGPKDIPVEVIELEQAPNVSDSVAEGVVSCLETVLKKCRLGSLDQMDVIMMRLACGTMLSPEEASEEFREGLIRCFKALLLNLCPCSDDSCPCKKIGGWPFVAAEEFQCPVARVSRDDSVSGECLLAFLQSEPASPAIGHWISLLLKAADIEATRGHRGSSKLRNEALITFRVLIAKVGTADALAFYLPGVVSKLAKVLHTSRAMVSGAAGSTEALNHAVRGFAEYLIIVLGDVPPKTLPSAPVESMSGISLHEEKTLASALEELRHLSAKNADQGEVIRSSIEYVERGIIVSKEDTTLASSNFRGGSLRVNRTSKWLADTSGHVNKLISSTFPHLCVHPSRKVKSAIVASVKALLYTCCNALKDSRLMLLECLCILVCDDFEDVSLDAQGFFQHLMSSGDEHRLKHDMSELFSRLVEKLPQVIMSNNDTVALSHARKLLAVTYFGGSQIVAEYLLRSPVAITRFLDVFALCLGQNSTFAGSLNKIAARRPSAAGFMHSIFEIKAITNINNDVSENFGLQSHKSSYQYEHIKNDYELPSMPPWFTQLGSQKLYEALAGILRLVSLYTLTDSQSEGSYSVLIDILLEHLRKLISELRNKQHQDESWQSWYERTGSGTLVRHASTAAFILNEMIFGLSDRSITYFARVFLSSSEHDIDKLLVNEDVLPEYWIRKKSQKSEAKNHIIECIGTILHEYLSPEIWDLPLGTSASIQQLREGGDISMHFFSDNGMLHQAMIEGVGVFNICLGKEFSSCGFLNSSLYLLLENIICSNFQVKRAADTVLHIISAIQNYPTVGHLVLANSDYVIDSICRQLRHLDLNPHVPNVLAAMLSYIGVADKILPLLEEPMHVVSMELEILGRHHHPNLTLPFLKAVTEITKSAKHEANRLPNQAESFKNDISSTFNTQKSEGKHSDRPGHYANGITDLEELDSVSDGETCSSRVDVQEEECESIVFKFNDFRRYRRIVGSIAGSCLVVVTPLIASVEPTECLTALDIVEDGILVLAKVEEAYKHENETKEAIAEVLESCSFHNLTDTLGAGVDEASENRLLPAANKIWPFLITCFRTKNLVAIRKCCHTTSTIVQICGGDFFSRRFYTDGIHIWKFLSSSPFHKKPLTREDRPPLQLPYRKSFTSSQEPPSSEISNLKVQIAILDMIADLTRNKRSSSSLESIFKKVSGIVIGIACSGVMPLQDACVNALVGLASIDPDLIWLLLADVYYSNPRTNMPPPPSAEFPEISRLLPPAASGKEYLHVLYGGQSFGFDVDLNAVENVFDKMRDRVFTDQM